MRKIYTCILLSLSLAFAASAVKVTPPTLESGSTSVYVMQCDNVYLKIDASKGGRITSLTINDSTNRLSYKRAAVEILNQSGELTQLGCTFWPSPQANWDGNSSTKSDWPPMPILDNSPYTVSVEGNTITLTSGLETQSSFNLRITKKIQFNPTDTSLIVNYKIINEKTTAQSWAPWEVTRVKSSGFTAFKKGEGSMTGPLYTNNPSRFSLESGFYWYKYADNIGTSGGEKMMCDGLGMWAHIPSEKNRILIKRFEDVALSGQANGVAPGESEVQVYTGQNNAYTELENQGAYVTLEPGASLTYTERWYPKVLPFSSSVFSDASGTALAAAFINQVIARGDAVASGIKNQTAKTTTIFVNSSLDVLTVETELSSYNNVEFVAYDLQGKVILKQALMDAQQQFSVKGLSKGSYLYQINNGSASIAKGKFMINR